MPGHGRTTGRTGGHLNPQLKWISTLLDSCSVAHWVDSGSLLGLVREGDLLEHDHDVDISMWSGSSDVLMRESKRFEQAGYKVRVFKYEGVPYKIHLVALTAGQRNVDINLFRSGSSHAWCPQHLRKPGAVARARFLSNPLEWYWRTVQPSVAIDRWPWRNMRELWTWWIPRRFFDDCVVDPRFGLPVPRDWEEYLRFRYGDWRVPKRNWDVRKDDGGLQPYHPDELLNGRLSAGDRPRRP